MQAIDYFLVSKPYATVGYSQPNYSSWWLGFFGACFEQFSLSFPDVNKNKGVVEMAPLKAP